MLNLLFNVHWAWDLLLGIGLVAVIIACIKFPSAKWFVTTVITLLMVASCVYSSIQLNYYYKAKGGIFGAITGIYKTNDVEVDALNFSLKNVELVKQHDDVYSAEILMQDVMRLSDGDTFVLYVNGEPCSMSVTENEEDYMIARYTYAFFDEDKNVILQDTLTFRFAFYTNGTYLSVTTEGGANAVKYWNYYFNKNVFDIKIEKGVYHYGDSIDIVDGDVSNFAVASYYIDGELYFRQVYPKGCNVYLPVQDNNYNVVGWKLSENGGYLTSYTICEDTNFYADVTYRHHLNLDTPTRYTTDCKNVGFTTYSMDISITYWSYNGNQFVKRTSTANITNRANDWKVGFDMLGCSNGHEMAFRCIFDVKVVNGQFVMSLNTSASESGVAQRFVTSGGNETTFYITDVFVDNLSFN